MPSEKIRIAFIKHGGLTIGGSEKLLQIIAAYLPKDVFEVDFYTCETAPSLGPQVQRLPSSPEREKFLRDHGVNIIKFRVGARDLRTYVQAWIDTDFWQVFDESKYDLVQTCRAGHKEYPFFKIRTVPILDIIALTAGVDNQYNIARVMHLNRWSADNWINRGGDKSRVALISLPIWVPAKQFGDFRQELGLQNKFVFGFHQRPDGRIFSPMPLAAYKKIEDDGTAFVLLGGGENYRRQARELNLKHIHFLPAAAEQEKIYKFLSTLNVFAHGRKDGEVNSQAMAEAMYFGLPIVSHPSEINNGHIESIGEAGKIADNIEEYAQELKRLRQDTDYYRKKSAAAKKRFAEKYELHGQINHIVAIYEDVIKNPFPHKFGRMVYGLHYTQNVRIWLASIYLFLKYRLGFEFLKKG